MGARPIDKAPGLATARSPRWPFTLAGTGTGSCRRPALVVDVDQQSLTGPNLGEYAEETLFSCWSAVVMLEVSLERVAQLAMSPRVQPRSERL